MATFGERIFSAEGEVGFEINADKTAQSHLKLTAEPGDLVVAAANNRRQIYLTA